MNGNLSPFRVAVGVLPPRKSFVAEMVKAGDPPCDANATYDIMMRQEVFKNDEYLVSIQKDVSHGFGGWKIWQLTINRIDGTAVHDWRDLQAIKNAVVGPDYEAIELFPAEPRLVDTTNSFHLFVVVQNETGQVPTIPIGWTKRRVGTAEMARNRGCMQRDPPKSWKRQADFLANGSWEAKR
jgi:hypothetical protein